MEASLCRGVSPAALAARPSPARGGSSSSSRRGAGRSPASLRRSQPLGADAARPRVALVRASSSEPDKRGASTADGFLNSPAGKFVSWLGNTITASKLNEGKVKLAQLQAGQYDESAIRSKVEKLIADEKVIIFSFSTCPFCIKAKALLDDMGVSFKALELNEMGQEGYAIRAELAKKTGRTSMPNIFIGGEGIGGCNDGPGIMTLYREGKLDAKLKAAGVTVA